MPLYKGDIRPEQSEFQTRELWSPYLESCPDYDAIIASGVLYHLVDPLKVLDLMTKRSDKIMRWTHYYDTAIVANSEDCELFAPLEQLNGTHYLGAKRLYREMAHSWNGFSGGTESYAIWMEKNSITTYFEQKGYRVSTAFHDTVHPNGPSLALCARR